MNWDDDKENYIKSEVSFLFSVLILEVCVTKPFRSKSGLYEVAILSKLNNFLFFILTLLYCTTLS